MPARPRKCIGKKVRFTPANITKNWALSHDGFIVKPDIRGNQCTNAPMRANTAPILKT